MSMQQTEHVDVVTSFQLVVQLNSTSWKLDTTLSTRKLRGMSIENDEVIRIFKESGALLEGHFLLRSGLHSAHFFQCAQVCQYMDKVTRLAELMLPMLKDYGATTVVGPAMGGLVIGQEVDRQLGLRFIFLEKVDDKLALRRNFTFKPGEKVLIVEDVITRGGRVIEALE